MIGEGLTEGEPSFVLCDDLRIRFARLVRGSSRRIMIMRFRPANISLINRRHYLPRLLLTLSPKHDDKNNLSDSQILTGHTISTSGWPTIGSEPCTIPNASIKAHVVVFINFRLRSHENMRTCLARKEHIHDRNELCRGPESAFISPSYSDQLPAE